MDDNILVFSIAPVILISYIGRKHSPSPTTATHDISSWRSIHVDNTDAIKAASGFPSYNLGWLIYYPSIKSHKPFLPRLDDKVNSIIQIRIPNRFLLKYYNPFISRRMVWGTDIYTDDSDIVAALYHSGFTPAGDKTTAAPIDPVDLDTTDGDCVATLRILPLLQRYQGSTRNGINSRSWITRHDGVSYRIESVQFVSRGKAEDRGWRMKKRRLEEWRLSREWQEERWGSPEIPNVDGSDEMDLDN